MGSRGYFLKVGPAGQNVDPARPPHRVGTHPQACHQQQECQPLEARLAQPDPDQCDGQRQQEQVVVPTNGREQEHCDRRQRTGEIPARGCIIGARPQPIGKEESGRQDCCIRQDDSCVSQERHLDHRLNIDAIMRRAPAKFLVQNARSEALAHPDRNSPEGREDSVVVVSISADTKNCDRDKAPMQQPRSTRRWRTQRRWIAKWSTKKTGKSFRVTAVPTQNPAQASTGRGVQRPTPE